MKYNILKFVIKKILKEFIRINVKGVYGIISLFKLSFKTFDFSLHLNTFLERKKNQKKSEKEANEKR